MSETNDPSKVTAETEAKLSEVDLGDRPVTFICHPGDIHVVNDRSDCVTISAEGTVMRADSLSNDEWEFLRQNVPFLELFRMVFGHDWVFGEKPIKEYSLAVRHVVGMILMIVETLHAGKKPYLAYPETYLHPKQQANLVTLITHFTGKT